MAAAPYEVRVYGKNRKERGGGKPSFWTDKDAWIAERKRATGREPTVVNVMSVSGEPWSRELSPMVLGPVSTYDGKTAVSVEVAWQYSRVYSQVMSDGKLEPTVFAHPDGSPTPQWFAWRHYNWGRAEFQHTHPDFKRHKNVIRRAFPKGSVSLWYWDGCMLDRVTARREIYARLYLQYALKTAAWKKLQDLHRNGDVFIFDNDGYDDIALGMTPDETLLTPDHPWGHGTLLAFMLRGIDPLKLGPASVRTPVKDHMHSKPLPKDAILLNKSADVYGWMNCMNNRYPVVDVKTEYPSVEHWFLCQRFPGDLKFQVKIREKSSGQIVKRWVRSEVKKGRAKPVRVRDAADLARMRRGLLLKLQQHPELIAPLLRTGSRMIAEDCTRRPDEQEIDGSQVTVPYWGVKLLGDGTYRGENHLGGLWMEIRDELRTNGVAMSPAGDIVVKADTPAPLQNPWDEPEVLDQSPLSAAEASELTKLEETIVHACAAAARNFQDMALACHFIAEKKLYRVHGTRDQYFREKFGWGRAHSYRVGQCGRLLAEKSASAPALADLTTQAHFRPLLALGDEPRVDATIAQVQEWRSKLPTLDVSPKVVEAAAKILNPPKHEPWAGRRLDAATLGKELDEARKLAPKLSSREIVKHIRRRVDALAFHRVPRPNGIDWSDRSWNPLFGCKPVSVGCEHCYAAKLFGTRLAGRFPGLVRNRKKGEPHQFNGTVRLDVAALAEPLEIAKPQMIFVNSLSDLFHDAVPDWFIDAVFHTMEQASWHKFQLLTKRPERMADYTIKRYGKNAPPEHIWLGATMEDQKAHDARMPHLQRTKAALRWVSVEPLLGPLKLDLDQIGWIVVGGESGSTRVMRPEWVNALKAQCAARSVPFFFKQWGYRIEDGTLASKSETDAYKELGGKVHQEFP